MNFANKVVLQIPLAKLWNDEGLIPARREGFKSRTELTKILRKYPVEFVIANVGSPLTWIPVNECFIHWKSEIKNHVVEDPERFSLWDFPNEWAYLASTCSSEQGSQIVLLEMQH